MAYGTYYTNRAPSMRDFIDPRDPRSTGGVTEGPPPVDPTTGQPPVVVTGPNRGYGRRYDGDREPDDRYKNDRNPGTIPPGAVPPAPPAPPTPAERRAHAYTGGALAYYGTGDIDDTDDFTWGSYATSGFRTDRPKEERGGYTIKNTSGMVFSNYPPKPSSIPLVLADPKFRRLYPNAKQVGFDKIDYGDGKPVDVLELADPATDTAKAWAWMPESDAVPDGAGAGLATWRTGGTTPPTTTPPQDTSVSDGARTAVTRRGYRGPSFRDWNGAGFDSWRDERGEP